MDSPIADAPLPAPIPYVGGIFGPYLIGTCFNSLFYGVLALQVLIYFMYYKQDRKWVKCYVLYLFFVETVNLGCNIVMIYDPLVMHYGTIRSITVWPILIGSIPTTSAAISVPVQVFTAWRIVILTRKKWIGAIIVALSLLSFGGAIWSAVVLATGKIYAKAFTIHKPVIFWYSTSLLVDVVVTIALYFSLSTRKTGFKSTDLMINKIIKLTLQTGLITLVLAVAELILFVTIDNTTNLAVQFCLSKLYSNALLSTLNSRLGWRTLGDVESRRAEDDNLLFGSPERASTPHPILTRRPPRNFDYNHGIEEYQLRGSAGKVPNANRFDTANLYATPARDSSQGEDILPITISKSFATHSTGNLSFN